MSNPFEPPLLKPDSPLAFKVVFQPSGQSGKVKAGITLLEAARSLGVGIESICGGAGTCGKCQVIIEESRFAKHDLTSSSEHVSPASEDERSICATRGLPAGVRLSCLAHVNGDLLVTVPEEARANRQIVRKAAAERVIQVDPIIRMALLTLDPPVLGDRSDQERILALLETRFGLKGPTFELSALKSLPTALREGHGEVSLTIWNDQAVIRVQPGLHDAPLGLAVDIGSTSLAAYLCDLHTGALLATTSAMNPQVTYGDDIMSRVSYAVETPNGRERLQRAVIHAINDLAAQAAAQANAMAEEIVDCVLVGNSVMHHLALGLDPAQLGHLPFAPVAGGPVDVAARDLGLKFNPGARVHVLPLEAGYVGADNVGVILAEEPHKQDDIVLIVDVGTNGEILLGNRERLLCTSSPTGPAFEGAQITHGMRAAPGAIERVRIDPHTLEVAIKVIGQDHWSAELPDEQIQARGICGSGILETVAELFTAGLVLPSGKFNPKRKSPRLIRGPKDQPAFILATAEQSATGSPIVLTQGDVRSVQLAKAALYVGAQLLMNERGVQQVDRIVLAGAFGSLIDRERAMIIGMIPDCPLDRVTAVGNAAGDGARIALLNKSSRTEAAQVARWTEHITAPLKTEFQEQFVAALPFPHASHPFPNVQRMIAERRKAARAGELFSQGEAENDQ
ncbi:MAG: ASKHA domain-containing protein [Bellilinea sp.]